jgi:glutamine synthetase
VTAWAIGPGVGQPLDKDIYDLSPEQLKSVPSLPGSLDEALDALEATTSSYSKEMCSRRA